MIWLNWLIMIFGLSQRRCSQVLHKRERTNFKTNGGHIWELRNEKRLYWKGFGQAWSTYGIELLPSMSRARPHLWIAWSYWSESDYCSSSRPSSWTPSAPEWKMDRSQSDSEHFYCQHRGSNAGIHKVLIMICSFLKLSFSLKFIIFIFFKPTFWFCSLEKWDRISWGQKGKWVFGDIKFGGGWKYVWSYAPITI